MAKGGTRRSRSASTTSSQSYYYSSEDDASDGKKKGKQKKLPRRPGPRHPHTCDPVRRTPAVSYGREYKESEILEAKKYIRDELELHEWNKQGYAKLPPGNLEAKQDNMERVKYEDWNEVSFREAFEIPSRPIMITGVMEREKWAAPEKWTLERLLEKYGDMPFDVGPNYPYMSLAKYLTYCENQKDDAPIYLFEPRFADHYPELDQDYRQPRYFTDDFYQFMGEGPRPFYKWILIGPERSGGGIHQDPFETSAWNTLVSGRKRWVMFPPDTPADLIKEPEDMEDESVVWYNEVYDKVKHLPGMIECVQHAGETIFIPGGWWHVVINLEYTVSVTANFASRVNWKKSFDSFKRKKPRYARLLYRKVPPRLRKQVSMSGLSSYSTTTYSEEVVTGSDGALSPSIFA